MGSMTEPPPSLLITFEDADQLDEHHREKLSQGRAFAPGEYELQPGARCEVVLVHPESGDSLAIDAQVESNGEEGVEVRFALTPLVRTRIDKLVGVPADSANIQARVRKLTGAQRRQMALTGNLNERTALERAFGKEVWDALLENPSLSVGEVVRLARNGAMPMPLIDRICNNNAWIKVAQVRRALLAHPRIDGAMVIRLLRFTPPAELKLVPAQSAYSALVRATARKLLGKT
jgi:hypothetical protein